MIEFSLRNRLLLVVLAVLVIGAGWFSYRSLPIDAFPDVSPNLVQVFTITEGLAPEEVEKFVTYPVETAMNGLPGVETIRSVSNFGLSVVNVYFEDELDIYFTRQLVNERLQAAGVAAFPLLDKPGVGGIFEEPAVAHLRQRVHRGPVVGPSQFPIEAAFAMTDFVFGLPFEVARTGVDRGNLVDEFLEPFADGGRFGPFAGLDGGGLRRAARQHVRDSRKITQPRRDPAIEPAPQ